MAISNSNPARRLSLFVLVALIALFGPLAAATAEDMTINSAINKSGRQRMLSQRMTKAYFQVGLNVRRDEALAQIDAAVKLFEHQLAELKGYTPAAAIAASLVA